MSKNSNVSTSRLVRRLIAVAAVASLSILAILMSPHPTDEDASALYIVANDSIVDIDDPAAEVFLTDSSAELVSRRSGNDLRLANKQKVAVQYNNTVISTESRSETVSRLLERLKIYPSPLEMVSVSFLEDGSVIIDIASELVFYERVSNFTEHEVIYRECNYRPDWFEGVVQAGQDGEHTEVYEVVYQDGEEISRQLIQNIDTEPVPTIIERGTMPNFANNDDAVSSIVTNEDGTGVITLENGQEVTFHEVRTMKGTAYTAWENPYVNDITATGTTVRPGVIAVDRKVLPLGTKAYIVSNDGMYQYGFSIAEDTGVRGNHVDLYMNTYDECIQFGVRNCTVYILD